MMIWIREILMVSLFITFSLQLVGGNGSSCDGPFKCCSGYKWDRYTEKCLPCEVGYYGGNCTEPCPFPSFGEDCQSFCNCSEDQCNHEKGCSKGETSIQSDTALMWKTLNEKEIGMVISITTLGLLFIVLTVMYIWVSHRLRVETNNRREATEDFDENSGA
ncbi:multiple epidermal growth factor-like domains protein 11 [Ostrea edulis]|uniref:multiple epidermal growth factor-like domains protein 11 n=1 Tax=Ostrea edulis TaxID=37623 RepID=UPI002096527F|nr:multiple epidermal growth factor-like domains protein 11 [Ostrea edulis]